MIGRTIQVGEEMSLNLTLKNPRTVEVSPIKATEEVWEGKRLVKLNFCDELIFEIGKEIKIGKYVFKVLFIDKSKTQQESFTYNLKTQKQITKTSMYILPFLGGDRFHFRWSKNLINAFIGTEEDGDYGSSIYLLCRYHGGKEYAEYEEKLSSHPNFKNLTNPDKYHDLFEFDIPKEYEEDVNKILRGKYSTISVKAKNRILDFHNSNENRPLGHILNKSPIKRLQMEKELEASIPETNELTDIFYYESEIFMNNFKILDGKSREHTSESESGSTF